MPGRNEIGERLQELCAEQELVVGNSMVRKKDECKHTWVRIMERKASDMELTDCVLLPKRIRRRR